MAKVTKRYKVVQVVQEEGITLDLTLEEAQVLRDILGSSEGNHYSREGKLMSDIYSELRPVTKAYNFSWLDQPLRVK